MITDREFVRSYSSFWNDTIPFCEAFVRSLNVSFLEQFSRQQVAQRTIAGRRALVNELAFSLFEHSSLEQAPVMSFFANRKALDKICRKTHRRISELEFANDAFPPPDLVEQVEALDIAKRLENYFAGIPYVDRIFRPHFAGCGVLDACEGDVFCLDTLYEIKSGDRNFRGPDLRQLLVYAALSMEARRYDVARVGLVNPRHGTHFVMNLDEFCKRLSGSPASDVLGRIIAFVSGGSASN
ncbi:hypothetical protein JQX13_48730 [Archangium violaceum]|uniref:hypothetical protein n=1 Tax=Archangium violaceum TaxID=83451 RepID=UPI00193B5D45|nr:hypothetical protein [Archangium violaceum]QRK07786.1 hypothetical protein JQX13_48730 [Archangium violaceum]